MPLETIFKRQKPLTLKDHKLLELRCRIDAKFIEAIVGPKLCEYTFVYSKLIDGGDSLRLLWQEMKLFDDAEPLEHRGLLTMLIYIYNLPKHKRREMATAINKTWPALNYRTGADASAHNATLYHLRLLAQLEHKENSQILENLRAEIEKTANNYNLACLDSIYLVQEKDRLAAAKVVNRALALLASTDQSKWFRKHDPDLAPLREIINVEKQFQQTAISAGMAIT